MGSITVTIRRGTATGIAAITIGRARRTREGRLGIDARRRSSALMSPRTRRAHIGSSRSTRRRSRPLAACSNARTYSDTPSPTTTSGRPASGGTTTRRHRWRSGTRPGERCGTPPASPRFRVPRPAAHRHHRARGARRRRPRARINHRPPVAPNAGALLAHPHRRETAGARRAGRRAPAHGWHGPSATATGTSPLTPALSPPNFAQAPLGKQAGRAGSSRRNPENTQQFPMIFDVSGPQRHSSRHSLLLSGSSPSGKLLIPLERRDGRVVEGARLESDSGDAHRVILKHLFAQSIQRLPATECFSM